MRGDGGEVPPRGGARDGVRGSLPAQVLQRRERQRQERGARFRLRKAGRLAEGADRLGEERHLGSGGQHRGGVVESAGAIAGGQRRHPQPLRQPGEVGGRALPGAGDPGGESAQVVRAGAGEGAQRVEGAGARALAPGGGERPQPERAREVGHQLSRAHLQPPADLPDGVIGHRQQDEVDVVQGRRLEPAAPVPGGEHPDSRGRERLEQRARHRASAQHCRGGDHSRRNSTPRSPAQASSRSPLFTRPARISSASGDSTTRWITCRMGRAPSESWNPPAAIR